MTRRRPSTIRFAVRPVAFRMRVLFGMAVACTLACRPDSREGAKPAIVHPPAELTVAANDLARDSDGGVTFLSFAMGKIGDADLEQLDRHPTLTRLRIQECPRVTDASLDRIAKLEALEQLELIRVPVSDSGIARLESAKALRRLALHHTSVTGAGLAPLAKLGLTDLQISGTGISREGLACVPTLTTLESLGLHLTSLPAEQWPPLAPLGRLRRLDLLTTRVSDAGIRVLDGMVDLSDLVFTTEAITDAGMEAIGALRSIRTLNLVDARITPSALRRLKDLSKLEVLELGPTIPDEGLRELPLLENLRELRLNATLMTGSSLDHLKTFKNLAVIDIRSARLSPTGKQVIADLTASRPEIRMVYISN